MGTRYFKNDGKQPWVHQQLRKTPIIQRKSSGCVQVVLLLPVFEPLFHCASRLERNPFLNDTLWVYGDNHWYAVLRFDALILKFDENFNKINSFNLNNSRLNLLIENLESVDPSKFTTLQALFRDIKYHNGFLYMMAPKTLIRVHPDSGKIASMYSFYKDTKEDTEVREVGGIFKTFAMMENNRVLLGPGWLYDHYLMEVTLPDIPTNTPNL